MKYGATLEYAKKHHPQQLVSLHLRSGHVVTGKVRNYDLFTVELSEVGTSGRGSAEVDIEEIEYVETFS